MYWSIYPSLSLPSVHLILWVHFNNLLCVSRLQFIFPVDVKCPCLNSWVLWVYTKVTPDDTHLVFTPCITLCNLLIPIAYSRDVRMSFMWLGYWRLHLTTRLWLETSSGPDEVTDCIAETPVTRNSKWHLGSEGGFQPRARKKLGLQPYSRETILKTTIGS